MGGARASVSNWKVAPQTVRAGCAKALKPPRGIPSNAVHVKLCMNPSGPPDKAKYSLATDSELVPRGKGEKHRCERSEIVPATISLQCVGAPKQFGVTACLLHNESASYCPWPA